MTKKTEVPKDEVEAFQRYRKAAEQGDAEAQYVLGERYSRGQGVPRDDDEAIRWYERAGEQGHVKAQYSLGLMYQNLLGSPAVTGAAWS